MPKEEPTINDLEAFYGNLENFLNRRPDANIEEAFNELGGNGVDERVRRASVLLRTAVGDIMTLPAKNLLKNIGVRIRRIRRNLSGAEPHTILVAIEEEHDKRREVSPTIVNGMANDDTIVQEPKEKEG